jgi:integrase
MPGIQRKHHIVTCGRSPTAFSVRCRTKSPLPWRLTISPHRAIDADVESRAGRRGIVPPAQLCELLEQHRAAHARERAHASTLWEEGDWMFAQANGRPIDPTMDRNELTRLLADAGVRDARLHHARHTAATVLLLLGVSERAAMELMGWSHNAMAKRYQHVTAVLRQDIASRWMASCGAN